MKQLFTLVLIFFTLLSFGQNNSQEYILKSSLHLNTGFGEIMGDFGYAIQTISTYDGDSNFFKVVDLSENSINQYALDFDIAQKDFVSIGTNFIYTSIIIHTII